MTKIGQIIFLVIAKFPDERKDIIVDCSIEEYGLKDSFNAKSYKKLYPEVEISIEEHLVILK